jgi:zinc D-Ala-D-Ala carboxypeptidase
MDREVSLKELLFSETATRLGIDNTPTDQILINLQTLIYEIINPIVNQFGDIKITSGYRSPELCKAIGSSITSQHTKGEAVDFVIPNISNQEASLWIVKNLEFDQCILEFWNPETNSGWVHCSYSKTNRKMYLRAFKSNGRVIYEVL